MFDFLHYEQLLEEVGPRYRDAWPFPHVFFDQFLDPNVALEAYERFPSLDKMESLRDMRQVKAQDPAVHKFDPLFREVIFNCFHSERFVKWVEQLTGIPDLQPDPYLYAAGLAQGGDGSYLNVHIDNSSHPTDPLYRRVNLILYLNKNWDESKGGHVEFWDSGVKRCRAILPIFNRAVFFSVSPKSWHGYKRVATPDGDTRKSINLYYFSKHSPTGEEYYHVTSFKARPGEWLNAVRFPIDNKIRMLYRLFRTEKDKHATLYADRQV